MHPLWQLCSTTVVRPTPGSSRFSAIFSIFTAKAAVSFVKSEAAAAAAADRTSCAETSQAARRATGGRASSSRVDSSNFDDDVKHRILRNLKADLYSHLKFNAKIFHSIQSFYNFKCWDSFRLPNTNQAVNLHRAAKALAGSLYFHWLDGARRAVLQPAMGTGRRAKPARAGADAR